MKFRYEAFNPDGTIAAGEIEAASRAEADATIREQGRFPSTVEPARASGASARGRRRSIGFDRLRLLAAFTRQMTVLTSSGTPLVDAMAAAERQTKPGEWRDVIADVRSHVERGESLSAAMARHPACFDAVYRSLIQAGEAGGDMKRILERLAGMVRQQQVTRSTITGAMVYPALLLVVSGSVLVALFVKVLPRFRELFETLNAPLPQSTAVLLAVSDFVTGNAIWVLAGLAVSLAALVCVGMSDRGRAAFQRVLIRIPVVGPAVRSFAVARLARVLGVMLESRVSLLECMSVAGVSVRNREYTALVDSAARRVERGEALSDSLEDGFLVNASFAEAVRNGEQTGQVGEVLTVFADMMDEDNAILARNVTSILEPAILTLLGVLVGGVALSLFLPLFDLTASTGGGP
ncbi:MAG: type II secretion system F family protein [Planctomycetota bacterium]